MGRITETTNTMLIADSTYPCRHTSNSGYEDMFMILADSVFRVKFLPTSSIALSDHWRLVKWAFNSKQKDAPCMHGLISKTNVWLLAGSTRLLKPDLYSLKNAWCISPVKAMLASRSWSIAQSLALTSLLTHTCRPHVVRTDPQARVEWHGYDGLFHQ